MNALECLLSALAVFAFVLGVRLGRYLGRREGMLNLKRAVLADAALRRARIAQDHAEHRDVFHDLPGLSEAERDAWSARELGTVSIEELRDDLAHAVAAHELDVRRAQAMGLHAPARSQDAPGAS